MYRKISDYGAIGNLLTVALVGLDGSMDWLCLPHMDSPSVFCALLDSAKGGRFSITPEGDWDSTASYAPNTNVLVTSFRTSAGEAELTDFMPVSEDLHAEEADQAHKVYRLVEAKRGEMDMAVTFDPRFDYARAETVVSASGGGLVATGGGQWLTLSCSRKLSDPEADGKVSVTRMRLSEGQGVWFRLSYGTGAYNKGSAGAISAEEAYAALEATRDFWTGWLGRSETGRPLDLGPYGPMVERSALILKLLYYNPTGAIAAAATTSLPEVIGGSRNWDYRYTWIRDTAFTLRALFDLGHLSETEGYLRWIEKIISGHGVEGMQIMYGLRGEPDLPEQELGHLEGYKGSRPVRIGNRAARQKQLDIYGELMDAALKLSDYVGRVDSSLWPLLREICNHVVSHWQETDSGIWEVRGGPRHYVYSKVMCWVALDRGVTIAERYGFPADLDTWRRTMGVIKDEVLSRGWSGRTQAFRQHYDTEALDSSNLLIPVLGFLPYDDPRVCANLEATRRELGRDGFLYRYLAEDSLEGEEGVFLLCSFWLADNLTARGELDEARGVLKALERVSNHLCLFPEEYGMRWREHLGNFPQAFTHIGYINSALNLRRAEIEAGGGPRLAVPRAPSINLALADRILLNGGGGGSVYAPDEIAGRLKESMNLLRGAFFDTARGRVAYERMSRSEAYRDYVGLSRSLKGMDLSRIKDSRERIAFWINLYNVIVIHGVVEMGIRDSVKEVRNFFRRVEYDIGGMVFSPDDIEHGILRGNRRPPWSVVRPFGAEDPRLAHIVEPLEPRIHFALVCASSSCPPIAVYTAAGLDEELDTSGRTFLNAGGLKVLRNDGRVVLSRVFKWYGSDFGPDRPAVLMALARYLYDEKDRLYLMENAEGVRISYQDYDWRLNRGA